MSDFDFLTAAQRTIDSEEAAVKGLKLRLDANFAAACRRILTCSGRVIVSGIGKSGHIAGKIAATLASTGTPAFFVHPGEASHGDFGMVTRDDIFIAISNSGKSSELLTLVPLIKRLGCPLIAMTGSATSPLAEAADFHLDAGVDNEACPLNLAPTSSTTAALVLGDALAIALLEARGFNEEDFARAHPGGQLGRRLLWRVADLMHSGPDLPLVGVDSSLVDTVAEMSRKGFGMCCVLDDASVLQGIFTDGDLRRAVERGIDTNKALTGEVMTRKPRTTSASTLAVEALNLMETHKITTLAVTGNNGQLEGILHLHDLLRAGII